MVFVWSNLTEGEPPRFIRIALDDTSIVFAAAPMVGLLLGLSSNHRALGEPLPIRGPLDRRAGDRSLSRGGLLLASGGEAALAATWRRGQPLSLLALLACWISGRSDLNAERCRISLNSLWPRLSRCSGSSPARRLARSSACWSMSRRCCPVARIVLSGATDITGCVRFDHRCTPRRPARRIWRSGDG